MTKGATIHVVPNEAGEPWALLEDKLTDIDHAALTLWLVARGIDVEDKVTVPEETIYQVLDFLSDSIRASCKEALDAIERATVQPHAEPGT